MTVVDLQGQEPRSHEVVSLGRPAKAPSLAERFGAQLDGWRRAQAEQRQRVDDFYANGVLRPAETMALSPERAKDPRLPELAERIMGLGPDAREMDLAAHGEAMAELLGYGTAADLAHMRYGREMDPRTLVQVLQADLNPNRERPFKTELDHFLAMDEAAQAEAARKWHEEKREEWWEGRVGALAHRGLNEWGMVPKRERTLSRRRDDARRLGLSGDALEQFVEPDPDEFIVEPLLEHTPWDQIRDEDLPKAQARYFEHLLSLDKARTVDAVLPLVSTPEAGAFIEAFARNGEFDRALFDLIPDHADRALASHVARTMAPTRMTAWWRDAATNLGEGSVETAHGVWQVARLAGRGWMLAGALAFQGDEAANALQQAWTDGDIAAAQWQELQRTKLQERGWWGEGTLMGFRSLPYTVLLAAPGGAKALGARMGIAARTGQALEAAGAARVAGGSGMAAAMASLSAHIHDQAVVRLAAEGKEVDESRVWAASLAGGFVSMLIERVQLRLVVDAYKPVSTMVRHGGVTPATAALAAGRTARLWISETAREIPQEAIEEFSANIAAAADSPLEDAVVEVAGMIPELFASMAVLTSFGVPGTTGLARRQARLAQADIDLKDTQTRVEMLRADRMAADQAIQGFKPEDATTEQWDLLVGAVRSAPSEEAASALVEMAGFANGEAFLEAVREEARIRARMYEEVQKGIDQYQEAVSRATQTRSELLGYDRDEQLDTYHPTDKQRAEQDDWVSRAEGLLPGSARTRFVDSVADLPADVLARAMGSRPSDDGKFAPEAFLDPSSGEVWMVRENIASGRRLRQVWFHEQVGHFGVEAFLKARGELFDAVRQRLEAEGVTPAVLESMESMEAYRGADTLTLYREYVAQIAEKALDDMDLTPRERGVWARIKAFLSRLFGGPAEARWEPRDGGERIAADLVREAMRWKQAGSPAPAAAERPVRSSLRATATAEPAPAADTVRPSAVEAPANLTETAVDSPDPRAADDAAELPGVVTAWGRSKPVLVPGESPIPARYALVDVDDLVPTHDPETFRPNPDHPLGNTRDYQRQSSLQQAVIDQARALSPDELLDMGGGNDRGGPVILSGGEVLGGNSRAMKMQRAARLHPEAMARYTEALRREADFAGIDPALVTSRSALVRVVEAASEAEARALVPKFNRAAQNAESAMEQAFSIAGLMDLDAVADLEVREGETLGAALRARGRALLDGLVAQRAIPREQYNRLVAPDGELTGEGADVLQMALFAKIVGSLDSYYDMTASQRDAVLRAVSGVLRVRAAIESELLDAAADLAPHIIPAVEAWTRRGDDYRQQEMFPEPMSRVAEGLATLFQAYSGRRAGIGPAMRRVADEVMAHAKQLAGEQDFLGMDEGPADFEAIAADALSREVSAELARQWEAQADQRLQAVERAQDGLLRAQEQQRKARGERAKAAAANAVEKATARLEEAQRGLEAVRQSPPPHMRFSMRREEQEARFDANRNLPLRVVVAEEDAPRSKRQALAWWRESGPREVVNERSGLRAVVTRHTVEKITSGEKPFPQARMAVVRHLEALFREAFDTHTRLDDGRDDRVDRVVEFHAPFWHDGELLRVRLLVKLYRQVVDLPTVLHSARIDDIHLEEEGGVRLARRTGVAERPQPAPSPDARATLSQLFGGVNPFREGGEGGKPLFSLRADGPRDDIQSLRARDRLRRGESEDLFDGQQAEPQDGDLFGTGAQAIDRPRQRAPQRQGEAQDLFADDLSEDRDDGQTSLFSFRRREFSDPAFGAALVLSERILRGGSVDQDAARALLPPDLSAQADQAVVDAYRMAEAMREQMAELEGREPRMTRAVLEAGLKEYYGGTLEEARRIGGDAGEQRARAKERLEAERKAGLRTRDEDYAQQAALDRAAQEAARRRLKLAMLPEPLASAEDNTEAEGDGGKKPEPLREESEVDKALAEAAARGQIQPVDSRQLLDQLAEEIRQGLVRAGAFTARLKDWKGQRAFRLAYQRSLVDILGRMVSDLTHGQTREQLRKKVANMAAAEQLPAIEARARDIVDEVNRNRVRQGRREMIREMHKLLRRWTGRIAYTRELKDDKISKPTQEFLNHAKRALDMGGEAARNRIEEIQQALGSYESEAKVHELQLELRALAQYGGLLKEARSLGDVAQALEDLRAAIDGGVASVVQAQEARAERLEKKRTALVRAFAAISQRRGRPAEDSAIVTLAMDTMVFGDRIRDLMGSDPEARRLGEEMNNAVAIGAQRARVDEARAVEALGNALRQAYGREDIGQLALELEAVRPEYARFSSSGNRALSRMNLLQIWMEMRQEHYADMARERTVETVDPETGEAAQHTVAKNEALAKRLARMGEIEAVLSPEDRRLADWLVGHYERQRGALSAVTEATLGVPVRSPDQFYAPAKMAPRAGGLPQQYFGLSVIPSALQPRVGHQRDLDETASPLRLFVQKARETSWYIHNAELAIEMRGVFAHPGVQEAMIEAHGKALSDRFLEHLVDSLNGQAPSDTGFEAIDTARGWYALFKLAGNLPVAVKQMASIPAFALYTARRGYTSRVAGAFTEAGREAMLEIWDSPQMRTRRSTGNSEAVRNAIQTMAPGRLRRFYQTLMITNSLGDAGPILLVGQAVYRSILASSEVAGMSRDEAKRHAMEQLFVMVEETQQSSATMNQPTWVRRGGAWGRLFSQFAGTVAQYGSKELLALRAVLRDPTSPEAWLAAARTMAINHMLLPGIFYGLDAILRALMGDELDDEEEARRILMAMLLGPASGFVLVGAWGAALADGLATGQDYAWAPRGSVPLAAFSEDLRAGGAVVHLLLTGQWEEIPATTDKIGRSLFAPHRTAGRLVENYTD